jgi:multidrug efflux pump subunit AcrB
VRAIIAGFVRHRVFANIVLVMILLVGILAVLKMIRETFPEFSMDKIRITVTYPGADPEEVEEGISRKIEESLEDVQGIKEYSTTSRENTSSTTVEIREGYELNDLLYRVRNRVDSISTFPVDAERPVIEEVLRREPVMMLALTGDMPETRAKEWAERVKDALVQLPEISQVVVLGTRPYEIGIEVSESRLREYGLSFEHVVDAVRRSSVNLTGGTLRTEGEEIRIRTLGRKYTGSELASVVVIARPTGEIITLDRLGTVVDGFTEDPVIATVSGKRAVFLNVMKTSEEDTLKIARSVRQFVSKQTPLLPEGLGIEVIYDWSVMLTARINLLLKNGLIGLSFVFLLLWIFLDLRLSFWAGMGMPISVAGALGIMWAIGATINMISLFGLIMVLGVIVDDAIIVGEAIYHSRRQGLSSVQAAVEALYEVGLPVIAAVLTTIVAFIPLAFVGGIMGKFISILPVVVISCLLVSLFECLLLLPAHLGHMRELSSEELSASRNPLRRFADRMHRATESGLDWLIQKPYLSFMRKVIKWRYVALSVSISLLLLTIGLVRGGIFKFQLFPSFDGFIISATAEFPDGTPIEVTQRAVTHIEESLMRVSRRHETVSGEPIVKHRITVIGQSIVTIGQSGAHVGSVQAIFVNSEDRRVMSSKLKVEWENEVGDIPGVQAMTFEEMEAGPPGAPIELWLQGQDIDTLRAASRDLQDRLKQFSGVSQVQSDYRTGRNELRLRLRPEARVLGVTVKDLATQVNAGYFGSEAIRLQRGRDDIRVRVRYTADERTQLSDLERIRIRTQAGREIPLLSVADIEFGPGLTSINRKNGMRNIAVTAEVDKSVANTREIAGSLEAGILDELMTDHPGVYIAVRGEKKRTQESFSSLKPGYTLALVGIFIIVATIFRSYVQPVIILMTVPFGIIGAVYGHMLMGLELSMMSMFGMVALTGVVVNDAIVLIESVNRNLRNGMPCFDAILQGGARRFRPVLLTSLSTIGGLMPLIIETDFQAQFLIPMALSLAAGVGFATIITLVIVPSLLAILNDLRRQAYRVFHTKMPTREEVEPATRRGLEEQG